MSEMMRNGNTVALELPTSTDNSVNEIETMEAEFSSKELEQINAFVDKIDILDSGLVIQYGNAPRNQIASASDSILKHIRTKDFDDANDIFSALIEELHGFRTDDIHFSSKLTFKIKKAISTLITRYTCVEANVSKIVNKLEEQRLVLMQDMDVLRRMEKANTLYIKQISMYILAGKKRLAQIRKDVLPTLETNSKTSTHDAEKYTQMLQACDNFEKKLYDLSLSKTVAMQMAVQIQILLKNDAMMLEKIQTIISNTIPLWKNQVMIALGIAHSIEAMKTESATNQMTNDILKANAIKLKNLKGEMAHESIRGIVDLETLTKTNQELVDTISDIQSIQKEGRARRKGAESVLQAVENYLHNTVTHI